LSQSGDIEVTDLCGLRVKLPPY